MHDHRGIVRREPLSLDYRGGCSVEKLVLHIGRAGADAENMAKITKPLDLAMRSIHHLLGNRPTEGLVNLPLDRARRKTSTMAHKREHVRLTFAGPAGKSGFVLRDG